MLRRGLGLTGIRHWQPRLFRILGPAQEFPRASEPSISDGRSRLFFPPKGIDSYVLSCAGLEECDYQRSSDGP